MNIKKLFISLIGLIVVVNPYIVSAEEASVSGNGAGSSNTVNIEVNQNNSTAQNNTAVVTNNVEVEANTGNNEASNNTGGETNIETGDVTTNVEIINAGINQSYAEIGCCQGAASASITGNGSGSNNDINYSVNNNTKVNISNNANIYNSIKGIANTGHNKANDNTGSSVSITTGDISVTDTIRNKSINIAYVEASAGTSGDVSMKIAGNGSDSYNSIDFADDNNVEVNVDNNANIVNESSWDLSTGGNQANGNTSADVKIATGDIVYTSTIENTDINVSYVDIECCEEGNDDPDPEAPAPCTSNCGGSNPCTSNCGGNSDNKSNGSANNPSGPTLPVTGGPSLMLLGIMNILMFFLGGYLRLRSGRSPNLAI